MAFRSPGSEASHLYALSGPRRQGTRHSDTIRQGTHRHLALALSTRVAPHVSVSVVYEGAAAVYVQTLPADCSERPPPPLTRIAAGAAWRSGGAATYMAVLLHSSNWLSTETS